MGSSLAVTTVESCCFLDDESPVLGALDVGTVADSPAVEGELDEEPGVVCSSKTFLPVNGLIIGKAFLSLFAGGGGAALLGLEADACENGVCWVRGVLAT